MKFWTFVLLAILQSLNSMVHGQTSVAIIRETFTWQNTGVISSAGTGSSRESLKVSMTTGYKWGGHNTAVQGGSIEATSNGVEFKTDSLGNSNRVGSYIYTIFSANGDSVATHSIDISGPGSTFKLYLQNADPDQSFRLMVRDISGVWYLSHTNFSNGCWSAIQGLGTPIVVDEDYTDAHKAFPINTFLWTRVDSAVIMNLNALSPNDNANLSLSSNIQPIDLTQITGAGIYVEAPQAITQQSLEIEKFELHHHEPLVIYNPAYSSHYITTPNGTTWGFSNLGGGGCGEFYYPSIDSLQNLNASGWGRAFQSAWRSFYHDGGYNPTQGGRTRNHGAPTPMATATSSTGIGTRIDYGPFQVATMGRPDFDILTYWDLTNGKIPGSQDTTEGIDYDGLSEIGLSEANEVMTEYHMSGFYEDVSSVLVNSSAGAIRIYNQYDYVDDPSMIHQYQSLLNSNFTNGITDLVAYTSVAELPNPVRPTRLGIFWGDRLWTSRFTQFWAPDSLGSGWVVDTVIPEVTPGNPWPVSHKRLTILSGPGDENTAEGVGMYFPAWSRFNQYCVAGIETLTDSLVYEEDRMIPGTLEYRYGHRGSGNFIQEQGSGNIVKDFIKRDIGFDVVGMVEPQYINGIRVHERLRFELFHLTGTPNEIKKAVANLDAYFQSIGIVGHDTVFSCGPYTWSNGQTYTVSTNSAMDTLISRFGTDSIVNLHLTVLQPKESWDTVQVCERYLWNGSWLLQSGTYPDTLIAVNGCDSIHTLYLNVMNVQTQVTLADTVAYATPGFQGYQWLECINGQYIPLSGQTFDSIVLSQNGSYAVVAMEGMCSDTSECILVQGIGMVPQDLSDFRIIPNPTTGNFRLENLSRVVHNLGPTDLILMDMTGRRVWSKKNFISENEVCVLPLIPSGPYVLHIQGQRDHLSLLLIKED